jgi:hypothetical protein
MKLPHASEAVVAREKVIHYLLSDTHSFGSYKAAFFARFGFHPEQWELLARALRAHAMAHEVRTIEDTPFGTRYTVDGALEAPDGRRPLIRTVWFVVPDARVPRLVTAYPIRRFP